ncbi:MAG: heat-inducible transcriptional repressor HrcA [Bacteroidota bacterium]|nr:heat-inducible transcriptional repressor HrcA [Bacteroidota bacterium]
MFNELTERQKEVLKYIIQNFILTATPIGSSFLAKQSDLGLSSASIRNVMADLEEQGFLSHPHVSAGRIPTDKAYRLYVNGLMEFNELDKLEQKTIFQDLIGISDTDDLLKETGKLLSRISHQLSIVSSPHLITGRLNRIEVIQISSSKILVILTIESLVVKTITMEFISDIRHSQLEKITSFLNERLSGLTLKEIRDTFYDRIKDAENEETGLIRLFLGNTDKLFSDFTSKERVHISGTKNILSQPEFESPEKVRSIIELIDNEDIIIHIIDRYEEKMSSEGITILIGSENDIEKLQNYSMIISSYNIGETKGTIGVIGPKRMEYQRLIPLVGYITEFVSSKN